jgi:hypothetical protein
MIETDCKWCKKMKSLCFIHTGYDIGRRLGRHRSISNRKSGQG